MLSLFYMATFINKFPQNWQSWCFFYYPLNETLCHVYSGGTCNVKSIGVALSFNCVTLIV